MTKHVLGILDVADALPQIVETAIRYRTDWASGAGRPHLSGKIGVLLFEKPSTRTRVSFESGMIRLGMQPITLNASESQLSRGERPKDTARVLSRYGDVIVARGRHELVSDLAQHATVPVINALTELEHPCQAIADLAALQDHFGSVRGRTLAWVGDGNNVLHSLLLAATTLGMNVNVATPDGYEPQARFVQAAREIGKRTGARVAMTTKPEKAVAGADAVVTDTWVSMGQENEESDRLHAFHGFTVDDALIGHAAPHAVVLHCLPAHYGQEITEAVADGPRSLIWDEAEYRLWAQMSLLTWLLQPQSVEPPTVAATARARGRTRAKS